jgi:hypothetical protein
MSYAVVRKLLEAALLAQSPTYPTSWENVPFSPTMGTAWQRATLMPGRTLDPTLGDGFMREVGVYQIDIYCAPDKGPAEAVARVEALRTWFKRGTSFVEGNVRVLVAGSPYLAPSMPDASWFRLTLSVPYLADVMP